MNRRAKGNRNENRSAEYLNKLGYYTMTSRASATAFDVVGIYLGEEFQFIPFVRIVQSKTNSKYSPSDIEVLRHHLIIWRKNPNANIQVELHDWLPNQRKPKITVITQEKISDFIYED